MVTKIAFSELNDNMQILSVEQKISLMQTITPANKTVACMHVAAA
jgi:hypothetical protein